MTALLLSRPHLPDETESLWPEKMTLTEIAMADQDKFLAACRIIYYSKRTTAWEKNFAKENANKQIWRIEHHWIVPAAECHASDKVEAIIKKILAQHGLNRIDLNKFRTDLDHAVAV